MEAVIKPTSPGPNSCTSFRFGVKIPTTLEGVEPSVLFPREAWTDQTKYDQNAKLLAELFIDNFSKYDNAESSLKDFGPKIKEKINV